MTTHSTARRGLSLLTMAILLPLVTGCFAGGNGSGAARGLCDGLEPRVRAHAVALATEGSDDVVLTGDALIESLDRACGRG
ncbi:hypothetical protein [uncultured Jannaschia sp.]|uniref:hypothetical protein n=1 Tax=uncultured Jannaschia sp. TaxID=293347 RepID=UPI0026174A8F|nr:hypothetical protein [uncultured Jannaschia sp.]